MIPSSSELTIQQRVRNHLGILSYGLRLLARLPADTSLVPGYSDGHTTICQVTLGQVEAMLRDSMNQLEVEAQRWQQPALVAEGAASASPNGAAPSDYLG